MNKYGFLALALSMLTVNGFVCGALQHRDEQKHREEQRAEYLTDLRVAQFAGIATLEYVSRHGGRLPNARHWEESIRPYWSEGPYTVLIKERPGDRLAMSSRLSGMELSQVPIDYPDGAIMFYETQSSNKDASGRPPSWKQCHECGNSTRGSQMVVFTDGWANFYAPGTGIGFTPKK